jgi:hypothetical protein
LDSSVGKTKEGEREVMTAGSKERETEEVEGKEREEEVLVKRSVTRCGPPAPRGVEGQVRVALSGAMVKEGQV